VSEDAPAREPDIVKEPKKPLLLSNS